MVATSSSYKGLSRHPCHGRRGRRSTTPSLHAGRRRPIHRRTASHTRGQGPGRSHTVPAMLQTLAGGAPALRLIEEPRHLKLVLRRARGDAHPPGRERLELRPALAAPLVARELVRLAGGGAPQDLAAELVRAAADGIGRPGPGLAKVAAAGRHEGGAAAPEPQLAAEGVALVGGKEEFEAVLAEVGLGQHEAVGVERVHGRVRQEPADTLQVADEEPAARSLKGEVREGLGRAAKGVVAGDVVVDVAGVAVVLDVRALKIRLHGQARIRGRQRALEACRHDKVDRVPFRAARQRVEVEREGLAQRLAPHPLGQVREARVRPHVGLDHVAVGRRRRAGVRGRSEGALGKRPRAFVDDELEDAHGDLVVVLHHGVEGAAAVAHDVGREALDDERLVEPARRIPARGTDL